jgi:hypothetical protein
MAQDYHQELLEKFHKFGKILGGIGVLIVILLLSMAFCAAITTGL